VKSRATLLVMMLVAFVAINAQAQEVPQTFGIWAYDSTFYIGASGIGDPRKAVEEYHMSFNQIYAQTIRASR
jgi:hypothetical protein